LNYDEKMPPLLMAPPGGAGPGFTDQMMLILIIFGIFYFIVFRPMRKGQREVEKMRAELKNGDRIVTSGGIYGTVVGVSEESIQLRVADQVKIQVAKSAVARLVEESDAKS
jgi:preprotein translocase subunit YajC